MIDGFIVVFNLEVEMFVSLSIMIALLVMPIMYFGGLWHTQWIYKIRMKELDKRYWYSRMGLLETGCLTIHTRFLR